MAFRVCAFTLETTAATKNKQTTTTTATAVAVAAVKGAISNGLEAT